jgi:ABC-2 type transport system permease protein
MNVADSVRGARRRSGHRLRRAMQITSAFTWMGYVGEVAYPLNFFLRQAQPVITAVVYYFVAQLVDSGASVAYDYYSFVIIGAVTIRVMDSGLGAFSATLETAVSEGRFEALLVEPIRWKLIPFGLAAWPIIVAVTTATLILAVSLSLGFHITAAGIPAALLITALAIAASHSLGVLAAAVKLLSKRGNPLIMLYTMAVTVLSGVLFPVQSLPVVIRALSYLLPTTYAVQAIRRVLLPEGDSLSGPSTLLSLVALASFCLVMYPFALWVYGRSLNTGRRYGTLAGY